MSLGKSQLISNDLIKATIETVIEAIKSKNLNRINSAVEQIQNESEALVNKQFAKTEAAVDCKIGCTYCCHNQVSVTPVEITLMIDHIKKNFSNDEVKALKLRVDDLYKVTAGMNAFERKKAKKACALLVNDKCSVYQVRPFACKGWNSMNVNDCETAFNSGQEINIQAFAPPLVITNSVSVGISESLKNSGLNAETLELNAALKIALEKYNVGEKYLDGKNIFKDAKLKT